MIGCKGKEITLLILCTELLGYYWLETTKNTKKIVLLFGKLYND